MERQNETLSPVKGATQNGSRLDRGPVEEGTVAYLIEAGDATPAFKSSWGDFDELGQKTQCIMHLQMTEGGMEHPHENCKYLPLALRCNDAVRSKQFQGHLSKELMTWLHPYAMRAVIVKDAAKETYSKYLMRRYSDTSDCVVFTYISAYDIYQLADVTVIYSYRKGISYSGSLEDDISIKCSAVAVSARRCNRPMSARGKVAEDKAGSNIDGNTYLWGPTPS
ncbi:hypothetical protein CBL_08220 [Carabus blaptoides fortunei]